MAFSNRDTREPLTATPENPTFLQVESTYQSARRSVTSGTQVATQVANRSEWLPTL
jgi:hypothetical protein